MDDDLLDVLLDIGFCDLTACFEEHQVTKEKLALLSVSEIKKIVPENRIEEFLKKREEFFESPLENSSIRKQNALVELNGYIERQSEIFVIDNVNIQDILNNSFEGKIILSWHQKKQRLDPRRRKRLVHFIITAVLKDCNRELNNNDFKILTKKIIKLFPTECSSVYFSPYTPKNKSQTGKLEKAKGKLLSKYFNLKKLLDFGASKKNNNEEIAIENIVEASDDIKTSVEWLNNYEEPWETAELHWRKTNEYRSSQLETAPGRKISIIYKQWPILKTPKGYKLIEIDFNVKGVCKIERANSDFHAFFNEASKVRSLRKDDHSDLLENKFEVEELNDNEKTLIELLLLCYMLPLTARIPQGRKKFWKPSSSESFDGLIAQIQDYGSIEKVKADRHTFAVAKNVTVQPYVIVVRKSDFEVSSVYICIDEIVCEVSTLLEALDICFKSFHVFNAKYTAQSEQIWLLMQLGLYKFRTNWDSTIIGVK